MNNKHIHFIGIGGIGISALARYYHQKWYTITGSDSADSELIHTLKEEGINIVIGEQPNVLSKEVEKVIFTEAIITKPDLSYEENLRNNSELATAQDLGIQTLSYPQALAEVFDNCFGIAITGTHGKSTTTSMIGIMQKDAGIYGSTLVGTLLKEFNNTNFYHGGDETFVIEACEYKRSFLNYHPKISVITNIDLDHLDYFKDEEDYLSAFRQFQSQTSDYIILNGLDKNCQKLKDPNKDQIWVYEDYFESTGSVEQRIEFPKIKLQIPGEHMQMDAKLAYVVGYLMEIEEEQILESLANYSGAWRRMETITTTENGNILMSDYGHHPDEIIPTLASLKDMHADKRLVVVFQPHQYSRTIELLDGFKECFNDADMLIIPNIYFSRDSKKDVESMPPERLVQELQETHPHVEFGDGLENTYSLLRRYDMNNPQSSVFLLLGAGDLDSIRSKEW